MRCTQTHCVSEPMPAQCPWYVMPVQTAWGSPCCTHLTVQLQMTLRCQIQVDQMIQQEQSISTPGEAANLQAAKQASESNPNMAGR